jgi:ABC-type uncharacterized transport system substrate-binding protein
MRRREFIALLGGAAVAWPFGARAQQRAMPVIGFLHLAGPDTFTHLATAFRDGLGETGYVEGRNVTIEYRWAHGQYDRLPSLAKDLVDRPVVAIFAGGGSVSARAVKAATTTIPIVFTTADDPVKAGLVISLNHPGGNMTGVSMIAVALVAKQLELMRELFPQVAIIAVLLNPNGSQAATHLQDAESAAPVLGRQIRILKASSEREIDKAFATLVEQRIGALLVGGDAFFLSRRNQIVASAARHVIPAIYEYREFTAAGGLMSYGTSLTDMYRQAGTQMGRILKGAKVADLPVLRPTKFELVVNLNAAKALGLALPESFLLRADEVIE